MQLNATQYDFQSSIQASSHFIPFHTISYHFILWNSKLFMSNIRNNNNSIYAFIYCLIFKKKLFPYQNINHLFHSLARKNCDHVFHAFEWNLLEFVLIWLNLTHRDFGYKKVIHFSKRWRYKRLKFKHVWHFRLFDIHIWTHCSYCC